LSEFFSGGFKAWAGQQRRRQNSKYIKVLQDGLTSLDKSMAEWNGAERKEKPKKPLHALLAALLAVFS
jgi:hypothetical protein